MSGQKGYSSKIAKGTRMGYIDFLGCISAFAVVMLHTNEVFHIFSYEAYC